MGPWSARAAAGRLAERGAELLGEPFEVGTGWTVEVADPWGNVIGLTDYVSRPELPAPRPAEVEPPDGRSAARPAHGHRMPPPLYR